MSIITIELLAEIKKHYCLSWSGIHGIPHWYRVHVNSTRLSAQIGVNSKVVELFSIFHDSQRRNDSHDKKHGKRGGELALKLRRYLPVDDDDLQLLVTACELHTSAKTHENITVQCCFDADRLDLGRVGIIPLAEYLSTPMAKMQETIEWAYHRSLNDNELPESPFGLSKTV